MYLNKGKIPAKQEEPAKNHPVIENVLGEALPVSA